MSANPESAQILRTLQEFLTNWDWEATEDDEFPPAGELDQAFGAAFHALEPPLNELGHTLQESLDGKSSWDDPDVRALAFALHNSNGQGAESPCDRCLTWAAHTFRAIDLAPAEVFALAEDEMRS